MILLESLGTTVDAVDKLSRSIAEYGILVVIAAIFLLVFIILFWVMNKRANALYATNLDQSKMLFQNLIDDKNQRDKTHSEQDEHFGDQLEKLVKIMTDTFELVKQRDEDLTNRSKRYITYSGCIKMFKNYFGSMKYDLIRECEKVIEKNHIDNTEALCRKINTIVNNMDKKRNVDFHEFNFGDSCLSMFFPATMNDELITLMKDFIQDRGREWDKFRNDLDLMCINYMNDIENKMQTSLKTNA